MTHESATPHNSRRAKITGCLTQLGEILAPTGLVAVFCSLWNASPQITALLTLATVCLVSILVYWPLITSRVPSALLGTVLVILITWFLLNYQIGRVRNQSAFVNQLPADYGSTYLVEQCVYYVDLTKWRPVPKDQINKPISPVTILRTERVRKVSDANEPFTLPFYTTGLKIDYMPLRYPVQPVYAPIAPPENSTGVKAFQYELPIGSQPKGYQANLMNQFVFWNGFRDPSQEWWAASVKYPTKRITVNISFPASKPCKSMRAFLRLGMSGEQEIKDNPPIWSTDGRYAVWSGEDFKPESRVYFRFQW